MLLTVRENRQMSNNILCLQSARLLATWHVADITQNRYTLSDDYRIYKLVITSLDFVNQLPSAQFRRSIPW